MVTEKGGNAVSLFLASSRIHSNDSTKLLHTDSHEVNLK